MQTVKLSQVTPDAAQPRKFFNPEKLFSLKESIKKHGIMSPLIVQEMGKDKYLLVDGERRWRMAKEIGLTEVPVIIEKPSPVAERLVRQFNVQEQHEEWLPTEKAEAIITLSDEIGLSLIETCKVLGVLPRDVTRYVAFANLPDKEGWMKGEMNLENSVALGSLIRETEKLYIANLEKEFTHNDKKKMQKRFIASVRNGEILSRSDVTRLKDAFQKNPKLVEKYLEDDKATPTGLFLSSKAQGSNALRNLTFSANYVNNHGTRFLSQPDVKISVDQLEKLQIALTVLKKVIDLA
jgi:ParB/RepB/Spo0J family partition protein